MKRRESKCKY